MINGFEFQDAGRTYVCTVEARNGDPEDSWWWFSVTSDAQRYAPFRAASVDTRQSVRDRVVAFYEHRRFMLTQPTVRPGAWQKKPAVEAAKPEVAAEPAKVAAKPAAKPIAKVLAKPAAKAKPVARVSAKPAAKKAAKTAKASKK